MSRRILGVLFLLSLGCSNFESNALLPKAGDPPPPGPVSGSQVDCLAPEAIKAVEEGIDFISIAKQLDQEGLGGWVHGSSPESSLFVFTWRQPDNFFVNYQFPIIPVSKEAAEQFRNINRHDQIAIRGCFINNRAPIPHLAVTALEVITPYTGPTAGEKWDATGLPDEVLQGSEIIAKVHAVTNGGTVIVVEYAGRVIPVFNMRPDLAQELFRNDKVVLRYEVRRSPERPYHLQVDLTKDQPIEVLEKIIEGHGKPIRLSGPLVMFPKSPQINRNIFALRTEDEDGVQRDYTFIPDFENDKAAMEKFVAFNEKLQATWDQMEDSMVYDRNKFINYQIRVSAKGIKNLVDRNQANPQIILKDVKDLVIETL